MDVQPNYDQIFHGDILSILCNIKEKISSEDRAKTYAFMVGDIFIR